MKYRGSRSPLGLLFTRLAFASLLLALVPVEFVKAQPGHPVPSLGELEKELQPRLDELAGRIMEDPQNGALYVTRSGIYKELYDRAGRQGDKGAAYAKKALADLSAAIDVSPTAEAYTARAGWYLTLLRDGREPAPGGFKASTDLRLRNKNFDAAKSDLLNSIRLDESDENLTAAFSALSEMHLRRAEGLAKGVELPEPAARGDGDSPPADFDAAIEYAKKAAHHGRNRDHEWPRYYRERVADSYAAKGRAATELGRYDVALEAFGAGEEYATDRYYQFCNYYNSWGDAFVKSKKFDRAIETFTAALTASNIAEWNCRRLLQPRAEAYAAAGDLRNALADYTALWEKTEECCRAELSVKRVKVHLRLNEPGEAAAILEDVFGRPGGVSCPQPYLLRAEAYRLLGNAEGASADERRARELGSPSYCVEY